MSCPTCYKTIFSIPIFKPNARQCFASLEPGPDLSLHLSHAIFHLFEDEALGGRSRSSDNGDNTELVH